MSIEKIFFLCDAPEFAQLRLQDPSTTTMEGLIAFNNHLLFVMTVALNAGYPAVVVGLEVLLYLAPRRL